MKNSVSEQTSSGHTKPEDANVLPLILGITIPTVLLILLLIIIFIIVIVIVNVIILRRMSKSKPYEEMEMQEGGGNAFQELFDPDADVADEESTSTSTTITGRSKGGNLCGTSFSTNLLTV